MAHREVQLLKTLKHKHVIRYYNSFHDEKSLYIVMEYCERGDLYKVLLLIYFINSIIVDKGIKI
jgi:serine/threonine protein kinase